MGREFIIALWALLLVWPALATANNQTDVNDGIEFYLLVDLSSTIDAAQFDSLWKHVEPQLLDSLKTGDRLYAAGFCAYPTPPYIDTVIQRNQHLADLIKILKDRVKRELAGNGDLTREHKKWTAFTIALERIVPHDSEHKVPDDTCYGERIILVLTDGKPDTKSSMGRGKPFPNMDTNMVLFADEYIPDLSCWDITFYGIRDAWCPPASSKIEHVNYYRFEQAHAFRSSLAASIGLMRAVSASRQKPPPDNPDPPFPSTLWEWVALIGATVSILVGSISLFFWYRRPRVTVEAKPEEGLPQVANAPGEESDFLPKESVTDIQFEIQIRRRGGNNPRYAVSKAMLVWGESCRGPLGKDFYDEIGFKDEEWKASFRLSDYGDGIKEALPKLTPDPSLEEEFKRRQRRHKNYLTQRKVEPAVTGGRCPAALMLGERGIELLVAVKRVKKFKRRKDNKVESKRWWRAYKLESCVENGEYTLYLKQLRWFWTWPWHWVSPRTSVTRERGR